MRERSTALLIVAVLLAADVAEAQTLNTGASVPDPNAAALAAPPPYAGVVPGGSNRPPRARQAARSRRPLVTWPGFQTLVNGSRIFVQSTRAVTWSRQAEARPTGRRRNRRRAQEAAPSANVIVIRINNAAIAPHNNTNALRTAYFDSTPISTARIVRHGRNLDLIIELKANADPNIHGEAGQDGYYYLYVDFPPGPYLSPEIELVPAEPAIAQSTTLQSVSLGESRAIRRGRSAAQEAAAAPAAPGTAPQGTTTTTITGAPPTQGRTPPVPELQVGPNPTYNVPAPPAPASGPAMEYGYEGM